jgi:hypothetical protein
MVIIDDIARDSLSGHNGGAATGIGNEVSIGFLHFAPISRLVADAYHFVAIA